MLDRLGAYRNALAKVEAQPDLGGKDELTEHFVREIDQLVREVIATIRTLPKDIPWNILSENIHSTDAVLESLRQARIQTIMALDSLPDRLMQLTFRQPKPEAFYQCLGTCREYMEQALAN